MRWWVFFFFFVFCVFLVPIYSKPHETYAAVTCYKLDLIGLFSTVVTSFLKLGITVWKIMHIHDLCNRQEHFYYRKSKCWCIVLASELLVNNHTDKWLPWLFFKKAIWDYKRYVFIRCRTEYEVKDQAAKGDEVTRKRFHAFVLFLGELYLNLEVSTFQ